MHLFSFQEHHQYQQVWHQPGPAHLPGGGGDVGGQWGGQNSGNTHSSLDTGFTTTWSVVTLTEYWLSLCTSFDYFTWIYISIINVECIHDKFWKIFKCNFGDKNLKKN